MMIIEIAPGTPTAWGVWCPSCLLPSAVDVPLNIISERGVTPLGAMRYCEGCRKQ